MKKYLKIIFIGVSISLFITCKPKIITEIKEANALPASAIFIADSVFNFNEKYKDVNKEIASSYVKQISDYEKTNPDKAIYCAKRAVTLLPSLENYKTLAALLGKFQKYDEQNIAFNFIAYKQWLSNNRANAEEYLFGKPDEDLFYESIVSKILSNAGLYDVSYYITELKFDANKIKERLKKDERIKMDREGEAFKHIFLQFLPYEAIANYAQQPENFKQFFNSIKDSTSFFALNETDIKQFDYRSAWDDGLPEEEINASVLNVYHTYEKIMDSTKWITFNMNRGFKLNPAISVIEYSVDSSEIACPKDMRHIYHRIIIFDTNAKMIDSKVIAYQNGEEIATVKFNKNKYVMTLSKRTFKKPYDKKDFDNDLLKTEKVKDISFAIRENGMIDELLN